MDAIRMIAYRAETAMVPLLPDTHTDQPATRAILRDMFLTAADILPEPDRHILRVRVHRSSRPAVDRRLHRLFAELNRTETTYPGTELGLVYEFVENPVADAENGIKLTPAG